MNSNPDDGPLPLSAIFTEEAQSLHLHLEQSLGASVSTSESGRWTALTPDCWPNWQSVRCSTLALAGAARSVESPVMEIVASTLVDVASRLDRCKAPVSAAGVQACREAVDLLGKEIEAFASGLSGMNGSQAISLAEKLDSITPR